jgi:hypothetical protein
MEIPIRLTLVDIGLGVVGQLVLLVDNGILGGASTGGDLGIVTLGDVLVGLLGSLSTGSLNGLGDVVGGVLNIELVSYWVEGTRVQARTLIVSIVKVVKVVG